MARKNTNPITIIAVLLVAIIAILIFGYASTFVTMNRVMAPRGLMSSGMAGSASGNSTDMGMAGGSGSNMSSGAISGMMGGGSAGNFSTQVSINTIESYANVVPHYVQRYANNNTLVFGSNNITLIVLAMGVHRAVNLTQEQPPSYDSNSSGNAFVIYGLINPTVIIPKGAIIHVKFVNLDSEDYHNVIMTAAGPPYQYMPMSAMNGIASMMPVIPHADYSSGYAYEYNYTTAFGNPGTYWYICMYPGHAQMGMYGKIIVE